VVKFRHVGNATELPEQAPDRHVSILGPQTRIR